MGIVYLARDPGLDRDIAIKTLPHEVGQDEEAMARLRREARLLASLNHPGIVTIYSVESIDDLPFLTMEFVQGEQLSHRIRPPGLPFEEILAISLPLAEALSTAHAAGIIHRDLKPGNIMVAQNGGVKVLDFGLASKTPKDASLDQLLSTAELATKANVVVGTVPYMAPETIRGAAIKPASDIFSLGVVLWELTTGVRPFEGKNAGELISSILCDEPKELGQRDDIPMGWLNLLRDCLAKDPARRPADGGAVLQQLRALRADSSGQVRVPAVDTVGRQSTRIAVLPLVDTSPMGDEEFIADGLTDALITDLARLTRLKVISRSSVFAYRGKAIPVREISAELRVDYVVEGTVLRANERIRVSVQLTRTVDSELLWAERYERRLEDIFQLQDELARAIAGSVGGKLECNSESKPPQPGVVDRQALLHVLRGKQMLHRRTEASFRNAVKNFRLALDIDPDYAAAHLGVAESLGMLANYGYEPSQSVRAAAVAAIDKGLELDPRNGDIHRQRAFNYWQFDFAWQLAIDEYEAALKLEPANWSNLYWYGAYLGVIGDFGKADVLLGQAADLDPLSLLIPSVRGWLLIFDRRFDEAEDRLSKVTQMDEDYLLAHWFLGEALVELERFEDGIAELEKAARLSNRSSRMLGYLGYGYGRAGRVGEAESLLEELSTRSAQDFVPPYFAALILAGLEKPDEAILTLEDAWRVRDTMLRDLKADPHWDRLRDHPRFVRLYEKMAFPDFGAAAI